MDEKKFNGPAEEEQISTEEIEQTKEALVEEVRLPVAPEEEISSQSNEDLDLWQNEQGPGENRRREARKSFIPATAWVMLGCLVAGLSFIYFRVASAERTRQLTDLDDARAESQKLKSELDRARLLQTAAEMALLKEQKMKLLRENIQRTRSDRELHLSQLKEVQQETAKAIEQFKILASEYHVTIRGRAKGLKFPEVETGSGKVFRDVVITGAYPEELAFQHSEGAVRVKEEDLPSWLRLKCGYALPSVVDSMLASFEMGSELKRNEESQDSKQVSDQGKLNFSEPVGKPQIQINPLKNEKEKESAPPAKTGNSRTDSEGLLPEEDIPPTT